MAGDDDVIEDAVVRIGPDLTGFRARLNAELKKALAGIEGQIPAKLELDGTDVRNAFVGLRTSMLREAQKLTRNFNEQVQRSERQAYEAQGKRLRSFGEKNAKDYADAYIAEGDRQNRRVRSAGEKLQQSREQAGEQDATRQATRVRSLGEKLEQAYEQASGLHIVRENRRVRNEGEAREQAQDRANTDEARRAVTRVRSVSEIVEQAEDQAVRAQLARSMARVRNLDEVVEKARSQADANELSRIRGHGEAMAKAEQDAYAEAARRGKTAMSQLEAEEKASISRRTAAWDKVTTGPKIIDWGGKGIRPMNLLLGVVSALSPALFAMGASAVQASTSVAALGAAGVGAALGITGLVIAFNGLSDLLALRKSVQAEKLTNAANSASDTVKNALQELQAKNNLIDATRAQISAEKDLHDARQEAARDLANLRQKVADLQNQQKEDTLSVAEAEANRNKVYRNYFASALDRARADQNVSNAKQKLSDTNLDRSQARSDLTSSVKKGVENSDKVNKAKEAVRQARERAAEARLSSQQQKLAGSTTKTTSAAAQLEQKLAEASPALRSMYELIDKNSDRMKAWTRQIQQAFLPGFTQFLDEVTTPPAKGKKSTVQFFVDQMAQLGTIISKYAGLFGAFTNTDLFREKFGTINDNNAKALDIMGQALGKLVDPLLRIVAAASPLTVRFAKGFDKFADWLDRVIKAADGNGSLAKWFEDAGTQMGLWVDIADNVITLLGNLVGGALPSGSSLVARFASFTDTLAKWSGGAEGQAEIGRFFDFFKNLPYGDIARFFEQAAGFFVAYRITTFLKGGVLNLFFAALTTFAASNPGAAASVLQVITTGVADMIKLVSDHPGWATGILAVLAAAKGAKTLGFDIKLPVLDSLKNALTSRFKVLEKFVGGGASTATMTVHAGVVNIYGGAAAVGKPGSTTVAAGGAGSKSAAAGIALTAGLSLGAVMAQQISTDGLSSFQKGMVGALQGALAGAAFGAMLGPIGAAAGAVIGGTAGVVLAHQGEVITAADKEREAARLVEENAKAYRDMNNRGPAAPKVNDPAVLNNKKVQDYIKAREEAVKARVAQARAAGGESLAQKVLNSERVKTVNTLSKMLTGYNYEADAAQKAAVQIAGSADALVRMNGSAEVAADLVKAMGDEVALAGIKVGDVNTKLDEFSGKKVATLEINGQDVVFATMKEALTYQRALLTGNSLASSAAAVTRDQEATKNKLYGHAAEGGLIGGYSPHSKADNIPTMLTANEYVQPVDVVKHYGVGFMNALRNKQIPRYAKGGLVNWPFKADISKTLIPAPVDPGLAVGDENVAETAEATARAMGATPKQLISLISAGIVESHLRNLTKAVDHDSVGFLQQRPSQGWGTVRQLTDVSYATRKYIQAAKRIDNPKLTAGELAARVQRPAAQYRGRYALQEGAAAAVLNRNAPFLPGYAGNPGAGAGAPTQASLIAFGHWLQARGYDVTEHPAFGGVGKHSDGSKHYSGHAIDVNHGAGTSKREQDYLAKIIGEAHRRGFHSIFMSAGHYNHAHFDYANGGLVGAKVPARKYDTGGTLPPGYTLAFNGTGRNETIRTERQEQQLTAGPMRLHRGDIALLANHIAQASNPAIHMDGRKVAETVNAYSYLPAGV